MICNNKSINYLRELKNMILSDKFNIYLAILQCCNIKVEVQDYRGGCMGWV